MPIYPVPNNEGVNIDPHEQLGLEGGPIQEVVTDLKESINENKREHPDHILDFINALDSNLT